MMTQVSFCTALLTFSCSKEGMLNTMLNTTATAVPFVFPSFLLAWSIRSIYQVVRLCEEEIRASGGKLISVRELITKIRQYFSTLFCIRAHLSLHRIFLQLVKVTHFTLQTKSPQKYDGKSVSLLWGLACKVNVKWRLRFGRNWEARKKRYMGWLVGFVIPAWLCGPPTTDPDPPWGCGLS